MTTQNVKVLEILKSGQSPTACALPPHFSHPCFFALRYVNSLYRFVVRTIQTDAPSRFPELGLRPLLYYRCYDVYGFFCEISPGGDEPYFVLTYKDQDPADKFMHFRGTRRSVQVVQMIFTDLRPWKPLLYFTPDFLRRLFGRIFQEDSNDR